MKVKWQDFILVIVSSHKNAYPYTYQKVILLNPISKRYFLFHIRMWNGDKNNPAMGTSSQFSLGSQRRSPYDIQRHSDRVVQNSFEVKREQNHFTHHPTNKISKTIMQNVKQENEDITDESSGSDDDEQDGIVDFCNDIKNHKKLLKKLM